MMGANYRNKVRCLTNIGAYLLIGILLSQPLVAAVSSVQASDDVKISESVTKSLSATRSFKFKPFQLIPAAQAKEKTKSSSVKAQDLQNPVSKTSSFQGINPKVLNLALKAHRKAHTMGIPRKQFLTVIDYSLPSTSRRLWVLDMTRNKVVYNAHVAHGSATGDNHAKHFSDAHGSHKSSLGLFLTGSTYQGKHGTSLTLHGLEKGFNGNAASRAIVMHPAGYVNEGMIKSMGRIGRSWGCPALSYSVAGPIIQTIKEGSLIFAYYPDNKWLNNSRFL
uniref:L,D-transpeptidase catalytic domain n=1 Tax=Candidatus Berkiella aquae TaxID=295108 RepID=A0A0Q9YJ92_9GAMM